VDSRSVVPAALTGRRSTHVVRRTVYTCRAPLSVARFSACSGIPRVFRGDAPRDPRARCLVRLARHPARIPGFPDARWSMSGPTRHGCLRAVAPKSPGSFFASPPAEGARTLLRSTCLARTSGEHKCGAAALHSRLSMRYARHWLGSPACGTLRAEHQTIVVHCPAC
jgi:hypothetical protein